MTADTGLEPHCKVIAEAGVNHNGDIEIAKDLVDAAASAGADAVKFQTFQPKEVATAQTEQADYQKERDASTNQYEMLDNVKLREEDHDVLMEYCQEVGIEFMSTPYDPESVEILESTGVDRYKVASADIVNKPLLSAIAETGKPVILSTGMANLGEIERAVEFLRSRNCEDVTLLHCVSSYPAKATQLNMRFIETLATAFPGQVGFSDHTRGVVAPVLAMGYGASVIEKHFTLDRGMEGPDHYASLEPDELSQMVDNVRFAEKAIGSTRRLISTVERNNKHSMRRSLHASRDIESGAAISPDDLLIVRPDEGIDPWNYDDVVGKSTTQEIPKHAPVTWDHIA
ncbi:N-acetylneuraminate synthase [Haloarcula sp. CBA1127]|uniref:N-acetylneuraminate synthase n=1 Tax=Haloarcula sp. CBA1127 TaxID=1765055 RepID=UPI00073E9E8C|nr:N-acetylneuraminate synthase [Haloarcula sp. CBA1127]